MDTNKAGGEAIARDVQRDKRAAWLDWQSFGTLANISDHALTNFDAGFMRAAQLYANAHPQPKPSALPDDMRDAEQIDRATAIALARAAGIRDHEWLEDQYDAIQRLCNLAATLKEKP